MSKYSQISFDFTPLPDGTDDPALGVRVKTLKNNDELPNSDEQSKTPAKAPNFLPEEADKTLIAGEEYRDIPELSSEAGAVATPEEKPAVSQAPLRGRKSQKTFAAEADLIEIPNDEQLFSKQYYTMGEVSAMFRVNPSLLRFWETEFSIIQPKKNKKGDRYFRPRDIKNLELIYDLLRRRKLTIDGARDFMKKNKKAEERFEMIKSLHHIRSFLQELRAEINIKNS